MEENHRPPRTAGGGIWITEKQIYWAFAWFAGFTFALYFILSIPSFITTKEQGQNTNQDLANLRTDVNALRKEQTDALATMESKLLTAINTSTLDVKGVVKTEHDERVKVDEDLRQQIANVRMLISNKAIN